MIKKIYYKYIYFNIKLPNAKLLFTVAIVTFSKIGR